jgi:hypothetical protein
MLIEHDDSIVVALIEHCWFDQHALSGADAAVLDPHLISYQVTGSACRP